MTSGGEDWGPTHVNLEHLTRFDVMASDGCKRRKTEWDEAVKLAVKVMFKLMQPRTNARR